jgi:hypothetical protein
MSRKVSHERWAVALRLADYGDRRELVRALLVVATVPKWVRKDLAGEDYDEPPLSDDDRKLLKAYYAYRREPRRPGEKKEDFLARMVAKKGKSVAAALDNLDQRRGRPAKRLRDYL